MGFGYMRFEFMWYVCMGFGYIVWVHVVCVCVVLVRIVSWRHGAY